MNETDQLVSMVINLLEDSETEISIVEKLQATFNLTENEAESVVELTQTGLFRAHFISSGVNYPKNHLSNNPIVASAIKLGLKKAGIVPPEITHYKRPWWKFW